MNECTLSRRTELIRTRATDCAVERRQIWGPQAQARTCSAGGGRRCRLRGDREERRGRRSTIYRTKRPFVIGNREAALSEEPRPGAGRKLSGKEEALLVANACSRRPPPRAACPGGACAARGRV